MQDRGASEEPGGDEPGETLTTADPPREGQQPDGGERHESARDRGYVKGDVVQQRVELAADDRRHDGGHEVEKTEKSDRHGGEAAHPAQSLGGVRQRRPPGAGRVGGDDCRLVLGAAALARGEALEPRSGREVDAGLQETRVHVCPGVDLHP